MDIGVGYDDRIVLRTYAKHAKGWKVTYKPSLAASAAFPRDTALQTLFFSELSAWGTSLIGALDCSFIDLSAESTASDPLRVVTAIGVALKRVEELSQWFEPEQAIHPGILSGVSDLGKKGVRFVLCPHNSDWFVQLDLSEHASRGFRRMSPNEQDCYFSSFLPSCVRLLGAMDRALVLFAVIPPQSRRLPVSLLQNVRGVFVRAYEVAMTH